MPARDRAVPRRGAGSARGGARPSRVLPCPWSFLMSWHDEVEGLTRRRALAREMGGPQGIARQRQRGKLTARERIDGLADPGSFREFMGLAGSGTYQDGKLTGFVPKPQVEGTVLLEGRK